MDKSSAFVWKAARSQVNGLPDCPADLAEPEYANLVYHARCHVCIHPVDNSPRSDVTQGCGRYTKTILWEVRRRYCTDCKIER